MLVQIKTILGSGMTVTNFSLPSLTDSISITATAKTRSDLDALKKVRDGDVNVVSRDLADRLWCVSFVT